MLRKCGNLEKAEFSRSPGPLLSTGRSRNKTSYRTVRRARSVKRDVEDPDHGPVFGAADNVAASDLCLDPLALLNEAGQRESGCQRVRIRIIMGQDQQRRNLLSASRVTGGGAARGPQPSHPVGATPWRRRGLALRSRSSRFSSHTIMEIPMGCLMDAPNPSAGTGQFTGCGRLSRGMPALQVSARVAIGAQHLLPVIVEVPQVVGRQALGHPGRLHLIGNRQAVMK